MKHRIGPKLEASLREAIAKWARGGLRLEHGPRFQEAPRGRFALLTDFVSLVHSEFRNGREPVFVAGQLNLELKVRDFFGIFVSLGSGEFLSVGQLFERDVAPGVASGAVEHVMDDYRLDEEEKKSLSAILLESNSASADDLHRDLVTSKKEMSEIARLVVETVDGEVGESSLKSLFYRQRGDNGFLTYGPWTWSSSGDATKVLKLGTERGAVTLTTSKYYVEDCSVQAHEWKAELHSNGPEQVCLAAAVGMVYKLPRSNGKARVGLRAVLDASDAVADTDILQMSAFINQHPDAADLVRKSNLCFVWIWQRSEHSEAGDGRLCLVRAIDQMKKTFGPLNTAVVNIVAEHLLPCGPFGEPAAIAVERVEALDKLHSVASLMGVEAGVEVRGIVNRHERDTDQDRLALLALAHPGLVG